MFLCLFVCFLFCFVLFLFVLFCFVLFCFVLFLFLFCFVCFLKHFLVELILKVAINVLSELFETDILTEYIGDGLSLYKVSF